MKQVITSSGSFVFEKKFFEDFVSGDKRRTGKRVITEADIDFHAKEPGQGNFRLQTVCNKKNETDENIG